MTAAPHGPPTHDPRLVDLARQILEVTEAAGLPSSVLTAEGWVVDASNAGEQVLGATRPLVDRHASEWLAGEDLDRVLAAAATALETGERQTVAYQFRHEGGGAVGYSSALVPLRIDGRAVAVQVVPSTSLDDDAVHTAIERQFVEYLRLLDRIDAAIYRFDRGASPGYTYVNARAERTLDVTLEEIRSDRTLPARRTHPDDIGKVAAARQDPENATWPLHLRWRDRAGEYMLLEVVEVEVRDDGGAIVASLGTVRNLTELDNEAAVLRAALEREQEAVDELRSVDELRQTFLRAVSHELRTPLTAVHGYAETLRTHLDRLSREQLGSLADRMLRNAERLRSLFDDLLDIDRMSRGTMAADLREADLVEVVLQALEGVEGRAGQVRADLHPAVANVDVAKMQRVIDNLVGNAIKHGGDAVTVWVRSRTDGDVAQLVVEDDGPGIPSGDRERLFEPFEQGNESATAHSPGTGLGLTLVRELTALQGGSVQIRDREGGGARFVLSFPSVTAVAGSPSAAGDPVHTRQRSPGG